LADALWASKAFSSANGIAPSNTVEYVPFSSNSLPIRRTSPSVDRITPDPMLARRTPSFSNVSILPWLLRGVYVPDIVTILASLYFILGDIDR